MSTELTATISITGNLDQLQQVIALLQGTGARVEPEPAPKATKKKVAKKKAAPKKDEAPAVDFQKVREAVQDVIQKKGRDVAVNLINSMGAEKVSGIAEEKWAETIAEAKALLEGE